MKWARERNAKLQARVRRARAARDEAAAAQAATTTAAGGAAATTEPASRQQERIRGDVDGMTDDELLQCVAGSGSRGWTV